MELTNESLEAARMAAGVTGASMAVWDGTSLTTAVAASVIASRAIRSRKTP